MNVSYNNVREYVQDWPSGALYNFKKYRYSGFITCNENGYPGGYAFVYVAPVDDTDEVFVAVDYNPLVLVQVFDSWDAARDELHRILNLDSFDAEEAKDAGYA